MNTGTISEQRKLTSTIQPTATATTTPDPSVIKTPAVDLVDKTTSLDKLEILDTTVKEPKQPKEPNHLQDSKCTFCKVDAIATLSFRFGLVLVLIALSYHLVKRPK